MSTAISLAADIRKLFELSQESDELTPEMLADTFESLEGALADKLDGMMGLMREYEGQAATCKAERERIAQREKHFSTYAASLKKYALQCLIASDKKSLKTDFNTFSVKPGSVSVIIDNQNAIPDEYVDVATIVAPDKAKIKKAIKEGIEIPGAHLETGSPSLAVR